MTAMTTTASEFNLRLRAAREKALYSQAAAWADARLRYPDVKSLRTIARLETDPHAEQNADPALVTVLADLYGTTLDELSPILAERARRMVLVLVGGGGSAGGGGPTSRQRGLQRRLAQAA